MLRSLAILLLAGALLAGACGDDSAQPSTTTRPDSSTTTVTDASTTTEAVTTTTEAATTTTDAVSTTTTTAAVSTTGAVDGEAGELQEEVAGLVPLAEEIRGLEFLSQPTITVLSKEELEERMREDLEENLDPAEVAVEQALYELLGMLDGTVDLGSALTELYAEQIGGRYLPETNELLVMGDAEVTPFTEFIIFHELVHALGDQHFGFADRLDELVDAERYHEAAALQALVEGDATYFQIVYFQQLSPEQQVAVATEMLSVDSSVAESLPKWLNDDLAFPYEAGFQFVSRVVADRGIAGVDQAYQIPPETVEQIIHPEKYFGFEPGLQIDLPGISLPGYEPELDGVFGEWNLSLFLSETIGSGDAIVASSGWGGDAYQVLWSGGDVAFAYRFVGDTPRDAEELEGALVEAVDAAMAVGGAVTDEDLGTTTFSGADFAFVQRVGATVVFVAAADPAAGADLAALLRLPAPPDGA